MLSSYYVEPELGVFPPIFIHSETRILVKIINNRDEFLNYEWRMHSNEQEEQEVLDFFDTYDPEERKRATNLLLYNSKNFTIDNLTGQIYPHGMKQVIISYNPKDAAVHEEKMYLYDTNSHERLTFSVRGVGIPPKAALSADMINCGHVALDTRYEYQITLKNTGEIPLKYNIKNDTERSLHFEFHPESGSVNTGESIPILAVVETTKVGQFQETFDIFIDECPIESLHLTIGGRVIGPSFEINPKQVDYGTVAYGFAYSQVFDIKNTSDIALEYKMEIPQDTTFDIREFSVSPNTGIVRPHSKASVKLEFIPNTLKDYSTQMIITNPKYENPLAKIPIQATCICPNIVVGNPDLNIGNCYIGHTKKINVILQNMSLFPGKYEYIDEEDHTSELDYDFNIEHVTGIVPARTKSEIGFFITPKQIGPFSFVRNFKIVGSGKREFTIRGISIGPTVEFDTKTVDFEKINVLNEQTKILTIFNNSPINANYFVSLKASDIFKINKEKEKLKPFEKTELEIKCLANDCLKFSSELTFYFNYLMPITIPIVAKGVGYPIVSNIEMNDINMDSVFVSENVTKEFTLTNFGKRSFEIKWEIKTQKDYTKKGSFPMFHVTPDQRVLFPGEVMNFAFVCSSKKPIQYKIHLNCILTIGKTKIVIFKPTVFGTFIEPTIEFENNELVFNYNHDYEKEEQISGPQIEGNSSTLIQPSKDLLKPITLQSSFVVRCEIIVNIFAEVEYPFSIHPNNWDAKPNEPIQFFVTFDPSFKQNFLNETVKSQIYFSFSNKAQKYKIDLTGKLNFSNINFVNVQNSTIDFGTKIQDSENQFIINIFNPGTIEANYEWTILKTGEDNPKTVFDICPIRGKLLPNCKDNVTVSYKALGDDTKSYHYSTALCHVIGGPDYTFTLKGNAAPLKYKVSPTEIDFGNRLYSDNLTTAIIIENQSQIELPFSVLVPKKLKFSFMNVDPMKSVVPPNSMKTVNVSIVPGSPVNYKEMIHIKLDQFEQTEIQFKVECQFNQLKMEIPRSENDVNVKHSKNKTESLEKIEKDLFIQNCSSPATKSRNIVSKKGQRQFVGNYNSHFVIDFGQIILGQKVTKSYEFTSLSPLASSFELFDSCLEKSGFKFVNKNFSQIYENEKYKIEIEFETIPEIKKIGKVLYEIPLVFSDENAYLIEIKAQIKTPLLSFSSKNIEFEETIIGQHRIKYIQVKNDNPVPLDLTVLPAVMTTHFNQPKESPFHFDLQKVTLEPFSFINLSLVFIPITENNFSYQIPIKVQYSNENININCSGNSVDLKITFDPPSIVFKPTFPFNDIYPEQDFKIVNNNKYPITVISNQFDFQLMSDQIRPLSPDLTQTPSQPLLIDDEEENVVKQLKIVVIVHGLPKSGKSTVCQILSKYLDLPLLCPKSIFEDKKDPKECKDLLSEILSMTSFAKGMIVDGLDGFDDPPESDQFIQQSLKKEKKLHEELQKNPFFVFPHPFTSASEQMLDMILSVLPNARYFGVFLNCSNETIIKNEQKYANENIKVEEEKKQQEIIRFFSMDEKEYLSLPPEEQQRIDEIRSKYRKEMLLKENVEEKVSHSSSKIPSAKKQKAAAKTTNKEVLYNITIGSLTTKLLTNLAVDILTLFPDKKCQDPHSINSIFVDANTEGYSDRILQFIPSYSDLSKKLINMTIPKPKLILESIENDKIRLEDSPLFFGLVNNEPPIVEQPREPQSPESPRRIRGSRRQERDPPKQIESENMYDGINLMNYTKRWELNPGESYQLKVNFTGQNIGDYNDNLRFSIENGSNYTFCLNLQGKVIYPDLDRSNEAIFSRIVPKLNQKTKNSFVLQNNEFHFGSILCQTGKIGGKNFVPAFKQSFRLFNPGVLPCEVSCFLTDQSTKTIMWNLENKNVTIKPHEESNVTFSMHPISPDVYKNKLCLYIKDNPDPIYIPIVADVCVPQLNLSTPNLEFDKILSKQTKTLKFSLTNTGRIPLSFSIKQLNTLTDAIKFSSDGGKLNVNQSTSINVTFSNQKPVTIKKQITIDVLDENNEKVYNSLHMNVNAEAFDTNFDFQCTKDNKNGHIDFGNLKVKDKKDITCYIKNKGKYPFNFVIEQNKKTPFVSLNTNQGQVNPSDKPLPIIFSFNPLKMLKIVKKPTFRLKVFDQITSTQTNQMEFALSGESQYSSYDISPQQLLDFGPVITGSNQTKTFEIINNGIFAFDWEILLSNETEDKESNNSKKATIKKKPPPKKGKQKLVVGQFSILNNTGQIPPGGKEQIPIEFLSNTDGTFSSSFYIKISNVPENQQFIVYNLSATTHTPVADMSNIEEVFSDMRICLRDDVERKESTCYLEDESCLHFTNNKVNGVEKITVNVPNHLPVPCVVIPTLLQPNTPFSISKQEIEIQPLSSSPIDVTFSPISDGLFKNTLQFRMKSNAKNIPLLSQIFLEGNATYPVINIIDNIESYSFGRTLLSTKKEKKIKIQNPTNISISVKMVYPKSKNFIVKELQNSVLSPGQEETFKVVFYPQEDGQFDFNVELNVENEKSYNILFSGQGHHEELVVDGENYEDDTLVFDDVVVDQQSSKILVMKNLSNDYIRYEWNLQNVDLTFSPSMGHIPPKQTEQLRITFRAEKPQKLNTKAVCCWSKIRRETTEKWNDNIIIKRFDVVQPSAPSSQKKSPRRSSNRRKVETPPNSSLNIMQEITEVAPEPEFTIIGGKCKDVVVKILAFSDYVKLSTSLTNDIKSKEKSAAISFLQTMMYETRKVNLYLLNQSNIKLHYQVKFSNFECNGFGDNPFSVSQTSGTIPSNSSSPLTISFSPIDVDDFSIDMTIVMPDVTENQVIKVYGTSVRPICFIDAVTAKDLPDGSKSIDVFTPQVGDKKLIKLGLRNTTNKIYEAHIKQIDGPRCVKCFTASPVIGAGRRYELEFEFKPISNRAAETVWEIEIPDHDLKQKFVIVGRVEPK